MLYSKQHTKSLGNKLPRLVKYAYYTVTLFVNMFWNKIPSRHLRKLVYILLGAKLGKGTYP